MWPVMSQRCSWETGIVMCYVHPHRFNVTQAFPLSYLTANGTETQKTETQSPWLPLKGRGRLKAWTQTSLITYTCSQLSVPQRRHNDMGNNTYQSNHKLQLAFECVYGCVAGKTSSLAESASPALPLRAAMRPHEWWSAGCESGTKIISKRLDGLS